MGDLIDRRGLVDAGALIDDAAGGLRGCDAFLVGLVTLGTGTTGLRSMTNIGGHEG